MLTKIRNLSKIRCTLLFAVAITVIFSTLFLGCEKKKLEEGERIVIWTSCSEFAQYVELFNKNHKDNRAVIVYKENPALSLPVSEDEQAPDIIVGPWLHSDNVKDNFKSLDYFFDNQILKSDVFYPQMLDSGRKDFTQYLLPVSFNLPAIIFSTENKDLISDNYTLSLEQIREIASSFNEKNKKGNYTRIGFTPLSNGDFLYLAAKLRGVNFVDDKGKYVWDEENINKVAAELRDWIITENTSAQVEEDFAFKYLFMPNYRQVNSGKTLFAYTTSDELLKIMKELGPDIDYRWLAEDQKIPMEDSYVMMGIYKDGKNQVGATEFITWFFDKQNQRAILERKEKFDLGTELFGISGGFSSLKDVTEHILPVFYTQLLTNLPPAQMLAVPPKLPAQWNSYREHVIDQYLRSYIWAENPETIPTIPQLEKEWRKKVFD